MRKLLLLMLAGLLMMAVLAACGNNEEEAEDSKAQQEETGDEEAMEDAGTEDVDGEADEDASSEDSADSNDGAIEVTEDPQTDLRLGDTGLVETSIGTYELTVHSAEIVGTELDGEEALLDELILLEMTFKNIGEEPIIAEDLMINLGLVTDLEGTDYTNAAASFDSIAYFEGEIAPGEEREAQFIADTRTAEEYYFRSSPGAVTAGTHGEVRWTILDEEARN